MSSSIKLITSLSKKVWKGRTSRDDEDGFEECDHDPKDDEAVQSLRESLLQEESLSPKPIDYHTLLRFLRMSGFDVPKAKDSILKYLKWREEFRVEAIAKEFTFEEYEEVQKYYPHGFHGVDRCGRPVYIERMGMLDLDSLLQKTTLERLVKHHVYEQEKTSRLRFPACSKATGKRVASTTAIVDVKGVGTSNFSKHARYLFLEFQKIDSNFYPETLNCLFIINAGSSFRILWKALRTFLDARTSSKIQVLGSNFKCRLLEVIDPSNLPTFLGGECTCSAYGGCMLSDKGPWKDPEILQLLQADKTKDEDHGAGAGAGAVIEEAWMSAQSTPDHRIRHYFREGSDIPLAQTINQLEITAKEAQNKILAVEAALQETKLVVQQFSQQIEDTKANLGTSIISSGVEIF